MIANLRFRSSNPLSKRSFSATLCVALTMTTVAGTAHSEEEKRVLEPGRWYPTLEGGLQVTQSAYSDNWSGGDKGSVVWTAIVNASLENQLKPTVNSLSTLKLSYGQTHQQKSAPDGERYWDRPEKSTDLIDFESIARFTLGGFVDPFVSFGLESQFQDATDLDGRTLTLNPIQLQETAGVARKFIDTENRALLSRLGFAFRQHFRRQFVMPPTGDAANRATDRKTETEGSNDGGLEWVTEYKTKVLEDRVTWTSKLRVYQAIFYSAQDDFDSVNDAEWLATGIDPEVADYSLAADADFENIFSTQITKILSVNLYLRWLYDKYDNSVVPVLASDGTLTNGTDIRTATRKAGQFKQTLAIGLTYRFL